MFALTLWQPWAHVVVHHGKRIENRTWAPSPNQVPIGTRFALHASKRYDLNSADMIREDHADVVRVVPGKDDVALGAIVGVATLVDILRSRDEAARRVPQHVRWWLGPIGLLLDDVIAIVPVPCAGSRGFWPVPGEIARMVTARARR